MRGKVRPVPDIPDHEVLRKIGGGSYGEVWLARGVTGAMRAVKVVRREDFEDERGFEREFEGILKYEPISRDHPGLVNILHVGRSDTEGEFYYYVMELGDDIVTGSDINPVEYEARNLLTDLKHANGKPIDPDIVIEVGLLLAEALDHLHKKGLAHRDIKPSNIIFVGGKAKLADIGLVAARGQRTFVGTEGFVPPEGPGSAQADVYGLGKVLYEMTTGKDRLQFPELPDELPENTNQKRWMALNQVICDICDPRVSKRSIKTAEELAEALRRLLRGKRVIRHRKASLLTILPIFAVLVMVAWLLRDRLPWGQNETSSSSPVTQAVAPPPAPIQYGFVKVLSDKEDVEVYDGEGKFLGLAPLAVKRMVAGTRYTFEFRLSGFRTVRKEGIVKANETEMIFQPMSIYSPPKEGMAWTDNMGAEYKPIDDYHISYGFVRLYQWRRYAATLKKKPVVENIEFSESGVKRHIILVTKKDAEAFCKWQTTEAIKAGYLNVSQYMTPQYEMSFKSPLLSETAKKRQLRPFRIMVKKIVYAHVTITSTPEGASVILNDVYKGVTPMTIERVKPGKNEIFLMMEGFRKSVHKFTVGDGEDRKMNVVLQRNNSVVFGQKWTNSLGMHFVPINEQLMVSAWETRVSDYREFVRQTKGKKGGQKMPPNPGFKQTPQHPIVMVNRQDAIAFCKWLTAREHANERISEDDEYRLITDYEWSLIAGVQDDPDATPAQRERKQSDLFPWGHSWPPEKAGFKVGNLADKSAARAVDMRRGHTLINYDDGFEKTSPVGSFHSNEFGIYDLAGNAQEWVSDDYNGQSGYGVLRGGGWNSAEREHLLVSHRNVVLPTKRSNRFGFRVVLAKKPVIPSFTSDGYYDTENNEAD